MNHFERLSLPISFDLEIPAIEAAYFAAQRQFHPDRFAGKPQVERNAAMLQSIAVNEAYAALKSPLKRAEALLALRGILVNTDKDTVKAGQALLMESLEAREALMEAEDAAAVNALEVKAVAQKEGCLKRLSELFAGEEYEQAAQGALRLGYLEKLLEECRQRKLKL